MSGFSERNKQVGIRKGAWTHEEDLLLTKCIEKYGEGKWRHVPVRAGLRRCRKSCRLRWLNYLQPGIKRGEFADDEVDLIIRLHKLLGNKWSLIAGRIPGRTANDIKNYWNAHLKKKLASIVKMEKNKKTVVATNNNNKNLSPPSGFTVIRPQPRTLSKARRLDGLGTTTKANCSTTYNKETNTNRSSSKEMNQSATISEDQTSWWKSFLLNCDVDEGCRSSFSGNGVGEEPFNMFWEREMEGVGWEDLFFNNASDLDTVGLLLE